MAETFDMSLPAVSKNLRCSTDGLIRAAASAVVAVRPGCPQEVADGAERPESLEAR